MHTRQNALQKWLNSVTTHANHKLLPLANDASFRRYFRLETPEATYIVMDAPPDKLSLQPFIQIAERLSQRGFRPPHIYAADAQLGFMLLEDFGDQIFQKALSAQNTEALYQQAIFTLANLQQCPTDGLIKFDQALMRQELSQFDEWFARRYLGLDLSQHECDLLQQTFGWISQTVAQQPQVFVHRDYHSRNIMVLSEPSDPLPKLGIIDFQDAVCGPWTYDLVSLLKDCYLEWPREQVIAWANYFYTTQSISHAGHFQTFMRDLDLCGLQRHLRVLGTFCRLCLRDDKPHYLQHLPLTFRYVMASLPQFDELAPFYAWMQQRVQPVLLDRLA